MASDLNYTPVCKEPDIQPRAVRRVLTMVRNNQSRHPDLRWQCLLVEAPKYLVAHGLDGREGKLPRLTLVERAQQHRTCRTLGVFEMSCYALGNSSYVRVRSVTWK